MQADLMSIGRSIREIRRGRFSVEALAREADVSSGLLSQLENGSGNPTIEVLARIADALEVELTDIIDPPASRPTELVRADHRHRQRVFGTSREVDLLTAGLRRDFTVTWTVLPPGEEMVSEHVFSGESLLYVVSGVYQVTTSTGVVNMSEGDSFLAHAATLISFKNPHDTIDLNAICVYYPFPQS
jgi:transcriptional regulator with XRE-family HTH domain